MQPRVGRCDVSRRELVAVVVAAFLALTAVAWPAPARAASLGGTSRAQSDYATDSFGDPWDFSNPEDFILTPSVQSEGVHNLAMSGGMLSGSADAGGKFEFLRSWKGMGLPWGRDPNVAASMACDVHPW